MLDISTAKVVRVIFLARKRGADDPQLVSYIDAMNVDERASLVALMWIGREDYDPDEAQAAFRDAGERADTAARYLAAQPELAEELEAGLDALGVDVTDAEDHLREH